MHAQRFKTTVTINFNTNQSLSLNISLTSDELSFSFIPRHNIDDVNLIELKPEQIKENIVYHY